MALQIRRGTDAERLALSGANAPAIGELIYTTDTKKLYVGDGSTAGGNAVDTTLAAQYLSVPSNITPDAPNTRDIGTSSANWRTGFFQNVTTTHIDAVTINGDIVSGDSTVIVNVGSGVVTADVTGNLTGNVQGNLTGNSTGIHTGTVKADDATVMIDGATKQLTNGVLDFNSNVITLQSGTDINVGTNNSASGVGFTIYNTDHTQRNALRIYADDGNGTTFNSIESFTSKGSIASPLANTSDDSLFGYVHYGHDGSQYVQSSFIVAGVDNALTNPVGAGAVPGVILLGTTPDNGVTVNSVVINSNGNLGVNVVNPVEKLDVDGNAQLTGSLLLGRFEDATARDTAIPTPTAGMMVYITVTSKFQGNTDGTITGWVDLN